MLLRNLNQGGMRGDGRAFQCTVELGLITFLAKTNHDVFVLNATQLGLCVFIKRKMKQD